MQTNPRNHRKNAQAIIADSRRIADMTDEEFALWAEEVKSNPKAHVANAVAPMLIEEIKRFRREKKEKTP